MTDKQTAKKPAKDSQGRFAKGNSGGGRKKGVPDRRTAPFRAAIDKAMPDILATVIKQAKAGDIQACKILLDKSLPSAKPVEEARPIPITGDTLSKKAASVVQAVSDGVISTDEGVRLLHALGGVARIIETDELDRRVAILEAQHGKT